MDKKSEKIYADIVEEFSGMVTRLCIVHTGNFTDAEDCYQNVFFKLFNALEKGSIPNVKAWLIKVTLNECRSVLRYRLRKNTVNISEVTAAAEDKREFEMLELIYGLPPRYRDVIYLYYYEQLTIEEISSVTRTKENTVKSQLKRGREKLKGLLEE